MASKALGPSGAASPPPAPSPPHSAGHAPASPQEAWSTAQMGCPGPAVLGDAKNLNSVTCYYFSELSCFHFKYFILHSIGDLENILNAITHHFLKT